MSWQEPALIYHFEGFTTVSRVRQFPLHWLTVVILGWSQQWNMNTIHLFDTQLSPACMPYTQPVRACHTLIYQVDHLLHSVSSLLTLHESY